MAQPQEALLALGLEPEQCKVRSVSGGDIHRAFRVEGAGQRFFIKDNHAAPNDIFALEADGLRALTEATQTEGLIKVPEVLAVGAHFLVLEWVDFDGAQTARSAQSLGAGLAAIHQRTAPHFGWHKNNYIGTLPQHNAPLADPRNGALFFGERRLLPLATAPRTQFPAELVHRVERFCERIDEFLPISEQQPSLLHGDLGGGNWSSDSEGQAWIYDPAVYFGCREAELAFTELFGGFGPEFYASYQERLPLDRGYRGRVDIWNLYPLLVHARLFGGGYIQRVNQTLTRLVG